jgi:predicted ATPase
MDKITDNGLYLLDEPENSVSLPNQIQIMEYLQQSARFFNCQFIIATHSPVFLSMQNAKIYNLDNEPATINKWTELENVKILFDFFMEHKDEF